MKKLLFSVVLTNFFVLTFAQPGAAQNETLSVLKYDDLSGSFPGKFPVKLPVSFGHYQNFYAKNSESQGLRKGSAASGPLAVNIFENTHASNSSVLPGPGIKYTSYELLSPADSKGKVTAENLAQLAFLDSNTVVGIASTQKSAALVFIDISGDKMYLTAKLPIPFENTDVLRERLFTDPGNHRVYLSVNSATPAAGNNGELTWKKAKNSLPGLWIIDAVKNEEKKWSINPENISVLYFHNEALTTYSKNGIRIQTIHGDEKGNIWMGFSDGLIGVLPLAGNIGNAVYLFNFNKDLSWINSVRNDFAAQMKERLRNSYSDEDTATVFDHMMLNPKAYTSAYLQDSRYTTYYNLVQDANSKLPAEETVPNEEAYWQYVHLDLDDPFAKSKQKLYDYFGFKVRKFQTQQNSLASGNDNSVYVTTNLGLYKLAFDNQKNTFSVAWSVPYSNGFLKDREQETASTATTPAFNPGHNEVAICDNDFPYCYLMILDATTGKLKNKFMLFDRAYGSAASNGIVFSGNTIVVANGFGNLPGYPASGIMKFSSTTRGTWHIDYDWNSTQAQTTTNTASPKLSSSAGTVYIYHQPADDQRWQISGISTQNKGLNSNTYSLAPDFGDAKINLNNNASNLTIGPNKSVFIGTANGLLRVKSE